MTWPMSNRYFLSYSILYPQIFAQPPSDLCHWFHIGRQDSQKSGRRNGPFTGQSNGYVKRNSPFPRPR
jgi:hypothetical protein